MTVSSRTPGLQRPEDGPVLVEQRFDALEPIGTLIRWQLQVRRHIRVVPLTEPYGVKAVLPNRRPQRVDLRSGEIRRCGDDDESRIQQDVRDLTKTTQMLRPCSADAGDVGVDAMDDVAHTEEVDKTALFEQPRLALASETFAIGCFLSGDQNQHRTLAVAFGA